MNENRQRPRVTLRCSLSLWNPRSGSITHTSTEDISCEGFYCLCNEAYIPGEELQAMLEVPSQDRRGQEAEGLTLLCRVEVVRTTIGSRDEGFGIACRINDYTVISNRRSQLTDFPFLQTAVQDPVALQSKIGESEQLVSSQIGLV